MSENVKEGDEVGIRYKGTLTDGTVFDESTEDSDPFRFVAGSESVIPGMSMGVIGMAVGETKNIEIEPDQAYGQVDDTMLATVNRDQVPKEVNVGDVLSDGQPDSQPWYVKTLTEEECVLDGNHPLAGKTLIFEVELLEIL